MWKLYWVALSLLLLSGCGEPKLDGSSEATMKTSIQKIVDSLPPEKQEQFSSDVKLLLFSNLDLAAVMRGDQTKDGAAAAMYAGLNGKTADQVSAEASALRVAAERKERDNALLEIDELDKKRLFSEHARAELSKFSVSNVRFYKEKTKYLTQPKIELSVANGTGVSISRAYFKGTLASPERSVPWLVSTFNYEVSGGLEAGESQSWVLAPNRYGDWGKVEPAENAVLTVEVVRLDGPDNKVILDSRLFTESDRQRLEQLKRKYKG
ncbi:DUF6694 family lipoprotein [Pseudomonas caspiana]|uniref:DUF6694 family lipoprotein n=1 Tax=Pseudomonas caspiana TaxID=1451454 RepID=UPI0032EFD002